MSEKHTKKGAIAKDTFIYMIAKFIEGLVGVLTISAMSYIYLPEDIGKYSTLNIAVTTLAMVLIQWLVQSVLRYISQYDAENNKPKFYSTVFFAWLKVNLIVAIFFSFFILLIFSFKNFGVLKDFLINYPVKLIIASTFLFFTYNTYQLIVAILAGLRKSKINLLISVTNVVFKLIFILILNNIFKVRIEWIFVSYVLVDFICCLIGILNLKIFKYINFKEKSEDILSTFKIYGIPLMGNMIAASILNKSDIYVINFFDGEYSSGIYQTNYSIVAAAFTLLSAGVMRGSYPIILKSWNDGKKEEAKALLAHSERNFILIAIPCVFGIYNLSDYISKVLFEERYFSGHVIMGSVAAGMLFLGLTEYAIKPWELHSKTKEIFKRSILSGVINIFLNLILIKYFGYKIAAFNTFLAFFIYFLLAKYGSRKYMKIKINKYSLIKIIISSIFMSIFIKFIKRFFAPSVISLVLIVFVSILIYFALLYILGEIKEEIGYILKKLKNKIRN